MRSVYHNRTTRMIRLIIRNTGSGKTSYANKLKTEKGETFEFEVTKENFDFMEKWFETPTASEMENGILIME